MKDMVKGGAGRPTQSAGAYLEIRTELRCVRAMPWQAEQKVVMMTDGSSISLACVAATPVEPKPECWRSWLTPSRD